MAPTEGRVARPEWRWGCRCGTPNLKGYACMATYRASHLDLTVHILYQSNLNAMSVQTIKADISWLLHVGCGCTRNSGSRRITNIGTRPRANLSNKRITQCLEVCGRHAVNIGQTACILSAGVGHRKELRTRQCFVVHVIHTRGLWITEHSVLPAQRRRDRRKIGDGVAPILDVRRPGNVQIRTPKAFQLEKQDVKFIDHRVNIIGERTEATAVDQGKFTMIKCLNGRSVKLFLMLWNMWIISCKLTRLSILGRWRLWP